MITRRILVVGLFVAVTWATLGKVELGDPLAWQERIEMTLPVKVDASIEQSFISQRNNLTAVAVWLDIPANSGKPGSVRYRLIERDSTDHEIAAGVVNVSRKDNYRLRFPRQPQSQHKEYLLRLELLESSSGQVITGASAEDEYRAGAALYDQTPLKGDLAFKLYYEYTLTTFLADLVTLLQQYPGTILAIVTLFTLPGLAFLAWLPLEKNISWLDTLALAVGLSMALIPVLLGFVTLIGQKISPTFLWLSLAVCLLLVSGRVYYYLVRPHPRLPKFSTWDIAALGLLVMGIAVDLIAVRELRFPLWTDSYHHTVITRLIIEQGQIPSNYQPYYPLEQFTYHFGFHAITAFVAILAHLNPAQAVLITGQIITALTGLTIYAMVVQLSGSRRIAFFAAATVLFINHLPSFYVNWGRYTQLAGQTLLPIFALVIVQILQRQRIEWRWLLAAIILAAGLFFVHYRVMVFGLMFIAAYGMAQPVRWIYGKKQLGSLLSRITLIGTGSLLLVSPWLWHISRAFLAKILIPSEFSTTLAKEAAGRGNYFDFHLTDLLTSGLNPPTWILVGVGLLFSLRYYKVLGRTCLIWIVLIIAGAYVHYIGPNLYSMTIALLALYLPGAVLAALALEKGWQVWNYLGRKFIPAGPWRLLAKEVRLAGLVIVLTYFGLQRMSIALPQNGFVRPADEQAIEWIQQHTPTSAKFLVNSVFWQPAVIEGRDAGWWLPLLARRETNVPLQRYLDDGSLEFILNTNQLARELENFRKPEESLDFLKRHNLRYIYIGHRPSRLTPSTFVGVTGYKVIYQADGAWVIEVE